MQLDMLLMVIGMVRERDSSILLGKTYPVDSSSFLATRSRQSYSAAKTLFSGGESSTRKLRMTSR